MRVRRIVHGLGYRYRLHASDLPGRPDLVFRPRRKVIFVHGCFWHRHEGCSRNRIPKSPESQAFWRDKLDGNARRDRLNQAALRDMGWGVLVIWECETKDVDQLAKEVTAFLGKAGAHQRMRAELLSPQSRHAVEAGQPTACRVKGYPTTAAIPVFPRHAGGIDRSPSFESFRMWDFLELRGVRDTSLRIWASRTAIGEAHSQGGHARSVRRVLRHA